MTSIILASGSQYRGTILRDVGLIFDQVKSTLDERALEAPLAEAKVAPEDRAEVLAEAKAIEVSKRHLDAYVLGCDQILSLDGEVLHKPQDMEAARRRLLALSGNTHTLHSAITLARGGQTLWSHVEPCSMKMRPLTPDYIGRHLALVGDEILNSVGAYQIEGSGAHLFESIGGDLFSIIGLPLLPLLAELRRLEVIDG